MVNVSAKLISQTHNLRCGEISLFVELLDQEQEELLKISPSVLYADSSLFNKFDGQDRENIAFWAGVEHARKQAVLVNNLKARVNAETRNAKKSHSN